MERASTRGRMELGTIERRNLLEMVRGGLWSTASIEHQREGSCFAASSSELS